MGRKPSVHLSLPPHLRARTRASGVTYYYYDHGGRPRRETPLGPDRIAAIKRWAELEGEHAKPTMLTDAIEQYVARELPSKAPKTQREYLGSIKRLLDFFHGAPLDEITPQHVTQYGRKHGQTPVQASRDKATLSAIFSYAIAEGYARGTNPCADIRFRGGKAQRSVYVSSDVLRLVYESGDDSLRDAMDLAYLTGQRPQDVIKMSESHIRDNVLLVDQQKVRKSSPSVLRINIVGRLAEVIERCRARKAGNKIRTLALLTNEHGRALTRNMLRNRFDAAREIAAAANLDLAEEIKQFQFRDLRARALSDKTEDVSLKAAQDLGGHKQITTTAIYVRSRGVKVEPNK